MRTYTDVLADLERIRQHIAGQGFKHKEPERHHQLVDSFTQQFWRRIDSTRLNHLCLLNDRVSLGLKASYGILPDRSANIDQGYLLLTLSIVHETQPNIWTNFELYSLTAEQILTQLPHLESMLIRAWNATHIDQSES